MHRQQKHMVFGREPVEPATEQGSTRQIKAARYFPPQQPSQPLACLELGAQVHHRQQRPLARLRHNLQRPSLDVHEARAQRLMAADELPERALKHRRIERPAHLEGSRDHISRLSGLHLVQEPEPLLRERKFRRSGFRGRLQWPSR